MPTHTNRSIYRFNCHYSLLNYPIKLDEISAAYQLQLQQSNNGMFNAAHPVMIERSRCNRVVAVDIMREDSALSANCYEQQIHHDCLTPAAVITLTAAVTSFAPLFLSFPHFLSC